MDGPEEGTPLPAGLGLVREARRIPIRSSARFARYSDATSLERMLKRIRSPVWVCTIPERADTRSMVPVFALRFRTAGGAWRAVPASSPAAEI